jgi:signal transduction histidine kinase
MTTKVLKSARWKLALSLFWFLFTLALVVWWWIFSLKQLDLLTGVLDVHKLESLKRMLLGEGAVLVSAVFFGGLTMVVLTNREVSRNQQLRNFFSNFTHDLKTSLTRLRLRAEVLSARAEGPEFEKLLSEVNRLDLQLENSLWVARAGSQKLFPQEIQLSSVIAFLRVEWPELEVKLHQDVQILADGQALKSVFRNLFQNSWLHGEAKRIDIKPSAEKSQWRIEITDDGKGFAGDYSELGSKLLKTRSEKGNGLGLFLTRDLLLQMNGKINFIKSNAGFSVELVLPRKGS